MTTATAPTRRVLSDMSINTPINIKHTSPSKLTSTTKILAVVETPVKSAHAQLMSQVAAELKENRSEDREGSNKRRKIGHDARVGGEGDGEGSREGDEGSPTSSLLGLGESGLDDSQNTVITVPDVEEVVSFGNVPPVVANLQPFSMAQIRAKATSARLRLSLASYKVRTNQIDVPISRLEVRSSTANTPTLPQLRRTVSNTSQRRTALPSAPSASSSFAGRGAGEGGVYSVTPRKSFEHPPSMAMERFQELARGVVEEEVEMGREGRPKNVYSTPILPRQRQGLLNPPLLERDDGKVELTSSVVKGRAADAMLSLGRMGREE